LVKPSWGAIGAAGLVLVMSACGGGHPPGRDGGAGRDARPGNDHPDAAGVADGPGCAGGAKQPTGQACACAADCASGICADGVCCSQACAGACQTCAAPGSEGTCVPRANGDAPRAPGACAVSATSSCGLDGLCDGTGKCRDYPVGTVCRPGSCDGASVVGVQLCDGAGVCRPGPAMICAPYACDPTSGRCASSCTGIDQCADGYACDAQGSCGRRRGGASCAADDDCLSGHCTDGVCCNTACAGPCVSCNLPSRGGICWPTDSGARDPHQICQAQGPAGCGQTGLCDGLGACALFPLGTLCAAPSCTGNVLNTAGTCDGLGTCRPPGLVSCTPFQCHAGACTADCNADVDCDTGISCVNHTCGPKQDGQLCKSGSECKSNHCVDGVCCDSACQGGCRGCALPGAIGKCTMAPAGSGDPRATCQDAGAGSCGTNGKCDGAGSCQLYARGTTCAPETCASNVYTPAAACDGGGRCVTPDALPCSPYSCNGSKCFNACAADAQCVAPNRCAASSCGLAGRGAACSSNAECKSNICAQGYCCDKSCSGACQSCGLPGTLGTCTNVATGSADPARLCKDQGATSCGTNGKCQAGACQKYASGTACGAATCPAGSVTFTGTPTCDGAGSCVRPAASSCFPYVCGSAACKAACTSDADCDLPAVCTNGACGLKAPGRTCASGAECKSGFCSQGVCCTTSCTGTCKSCNVSAATAGTCTSVPAGQPDPQATCKDQGAGSCGTNGACDGAGACQKYAAGTVCAASSCAAGLSIQTNARTCDGKGVCQAATTTKCSPFACNGTTSCNTACKGDADCLSPNICDPKSSLCGNKKRQGQACGATADCLTGLGCVDGVCCGATGAACPECQACNVSGHAGTCAPVPVGTACGAASCTAGTPADAACTGGGHYCDANGACQAKKTPGTACASTAECAIGVCGAEHVCCDTACDGLCMSCKLASAMGTCSMLPMCGADGGTGD
jgi:hypothetical protein